MRRTVGGVIPAQPPSLRRLEPGPVRKLANWETIPVVPKGFRILREGTSYSEQYEPWPAGGTRMYAEVLGKGRCRMWSSETTTFGNDDERNP